MNAPVVSAGKMAAMAVTLLISFGLPIFLSIYWHKKTGARWVCAFIGAITFVVFVIGLENVCHQFFVYKDTPMSAFLKTHDWAYVLYGALAAGIFEETGRLVAFKWALRKETRREAGVMYGVGHGGVEAILVAGVAAIVNLVFAFTLNSTGAEAMLQATGEAGRASLEAMIAAISTTGAGMFLASGVERISAVAVHIALSVFVFTAAKRPGKLYLYPAAILLHAAVDAFAMLYTLGVIPGIWAIELGVAALAAGICVLAWRIYKADRPEEAPPAEDAPEEPLCE